MDLVLVDFRAVVPELGNKQKVLVWIVAIVLAGLSLMVHLTSPSTLSMGEDAWQQKVMYHRDYPILAARPLTTGIVTVANDVLGLGFREGFFSLQFLLYLVCGPVFFLYLHRLGFSFGQALSGMVIFQLSLPTFLAHFEPIHTWDDFWLYLMAPLAMALSLMRLHIPALLAMICSLIGRETSLIILPFWAVIVYREGAGPGWRRAAVYTAGALILSGSLRLILSSGSAVSPELSLGFNFDGLLRTRDTLFSGLVSLGALWLVGLWQASRRSAVAISYEGWLRAGAFVTAAGFVSSTLLFGHARETRLLWPPAIFMIPLALIYWRERTQAVRRLFRLHPSWLVVLLSMALLAAWVGLAQLLFGEFEYRSWRDGNWFYCGLHLWLLTIFVLVEFLARRNRTE